MARGNGLLVATGGYTPVVNANTSAVAILLPSISDDTGGTLTLRLVAESRDPAGSPVAVSRQP